MIIKNNYFFFKIIILNYNSKLIGKKKKMSKTYKRQVDKDKKYQKKKQKKEQVKQIKKYKNNYDDILEEEIELYDIDSKYCDEIFDRLAI